MKITNSVTSRNERFKNCRAYLVTQPRKTFRHLLIHCLYLGLNTRPTLFLQKDHYGSVKRKVLLYNLLKVVLVSEKFRKIYFPSSNP